MTFDKQPLMSLVKPQRFDVSRQWSEWGMFSKAGDKSITTKAQRLVDEIVAGKNIVKATQKFLRSYRNMSSTKNFSEASDTAVRECVWMFVEGILGYNLADEIWESKLAYPKSERW